MEWLSCSSTRTPHGALLLTLLTVLLNTPLPGIAAQPASPIATWDCNPLDPLDALPTAIPCFRAWLSGTNRVTLEWRVANTAGPIVFVYDTVAAPYEDPGFKPARCASGPLDGCAISLEVEQGGYYRWVLSIASTTGAPIYVATDLMVPSLYAPDVSPRLTKVDMLNPTDVYFSWTPDPRNGIAASDTDTAWIELRRPGSLLWDSGHYPRYNGGYSVPASALAQAGTRVFGARECYLPPGAQTKLCSRETSFGVAVGYDRFLGSNHRHVAAGEDVEVEFSTDSGDVHLLASRSLVPLNNGLRLTATLDNRYTIDGARLTPGVHTLDLISCAWAEGRCSNREDFIAPVNGQITLQHATGAVAQGEALYLFFSTDGIEQILAPYTGIFFLTIEDVQFPFHPVAAGGTIGFLVTTNRDTLHLVVDSPMEWNIGRDYTHDFSLGSAHTVLGPGGALDVTFDDKEGVWLLNEFANNIEHLSSAGKMETINMPLLRDPLSAPTAFAPITPFWFWGPDPLSAGLEVSISVLGERVLQNGALIWFTQGGGFDPTTSSRTNNSSRIVSIDPSVEDSPTTVYDDRVCAYNLPNSSPSEMDSEPLAPGQQLVGLAAARGKIWVAESHGLFSDKPSAISSFIPGQTACGNLLNFGDQSILDSEHLQYCLDGQTAEQDGCMERLLLPSGDEYDHPRNVKVAHLMADPVDDSIWFTDAWGQYLGNVNPDREDSLTLHAMDKIHSDILPFGGFPWSLQVDANAVYFVEYMTRHIVRFDKATQTFHEIFVPYASEEVNLHSLALDTMRNRLWFTLTNEGQVPTDTAASTIGFVDLSDWQRYIENPDSGERIAGTIYRGLDSIPAADGAPGEHQNFRGIAFDPATGRIALATGRREQITVLDPLPGFWP